MGLQHEWVGFHLTFQDKYEAIEREMQREEIRSLLEEEERVKEEEADRKRQKRLEEALQRRKTREEQQEKQRLEEEGNWEKAMSGELSGRRKAAIGAAENVSEVQRLAEEDFLIVDKEFDLYTAMHKSKLRVALALPCGVALALPCGVALALPCGVALALPCGVGSVMLS